MTENNAPHSNGDGQTVDSLPQWAQNMIRSLRSEAAQNRQAVTEAQSERDTLRDQLAGIHSKAALEGLADVLADPEDLARYVDTTELVGEDGTPDPAKYLEAARTLTTERPHLAPRTPTRSGSEVGGSVRRPTVTDPEHQQAAGTQDFVTLVQSAL